MKLFIDTANVKEIEAASKWGVIDGVTTNPTLIAREGREVKEVIGEICELIDGPISAEVMSLEANEMIAEAEILVTLHKNIVIKIPMCEEGVKAVSVLSKRGIKTNVTLIFSAQQALMAAKAGATYVSPFVGRVDDTGSRGMTLIEDIAQVFNVYGMETEIIAASIRSQNHVLECAKAGAHIATCPFTVLKQMFVHPLTDKGIEQFLKDAELVTA